MTQPPHYPVPSYAPNPHSATQPPSAPYPHALASITPAVVVNLDSRPEGRFTFDGGAGNFFLVSLGATLLTVCTLGLALPWAMCMLYRWQADHTIINGRRLRFLGTGGGLFGHYLKWWALTIVTLGIYSFWVYPRMTKCAWSARTSANP